MLLSFLKPQHSHILLQREVSIFATSMVGARPRATCPPRPRRATCPICHKSFLRKTSLTVHVETVHENIKSFVCEICTKMYVSKSDLCKHIKTVHENLRPSECKKCFGVCVSELVHSKLTSFVELHCNPRKLFIF